MRLNLILLIGVAISGCTRFVTVVDPSGKPIEGAQLQAVAISPGERTNSKGEGNFPWAMKELTTMVRVSKPGYQTVILPLQNPVVLQPTTAP